MVMKVKFTTAISVLAFFAGTALAVGAGTGPGRGIDPEEYAAMTVD